MLSEISQTEKDKYYMISIICELWKNKKKNSYREQVCGCLRRELGVEGNGWKWSKDTNFQL